MESAGISKPADSIRRQLNGARVVSSQFQEQRRGDFQRERSTSKIGKGIKNLESAREMVSKIKVGMFPRMAQPEPLSQAAALPVER